MADGVAPAEGEGTGVVRSRWLWAARCCALICAIALGVGFVAEAAPHDLMAGLITFGRWGAVSLALLYLLFRRGKNPQAFALGLGTATAFLVLLGLATVELSSVRGGLRHLLFILGMFSGGLPPFLGEGGSPQLAMLRALLLWLFSISSAILGVSSVVAFQKMAREEKGMAKLRFAFGAGIFCAPVVWVMFMLLWLLLIGPFRM